MVEGESSRLFEKKDVPSPEVDTETYEMIEKPVDELVEMAGQNIPRREENEENSDCYKPTVISGRQNSHKWSRMDFSESNLKKQVRGGKRFLWKGIIFLLIVAFLNLKLLAKSSVFFVTQAYQMLNLEK